VPWVSGGGDEGAHVHNRVGFLHHRLDRPITFQIDRQVALTSPDAEVASLYFRRAYCSFALSSVRRYIGDHAELGGFTSTNEVRDGNGPPNSPMMATTIIDFHDREAGGQQKGARKAMSPGGFSSSPRKDPGWDQTSYATHSTFRCPQRAQVWNQHEIEKWALRSGGGTARLREGRGACHAPVVLLLSQTAGPQVAGERTVIG